ncbi:hypothetical protein C8D70_112138 [Chryseobacterium sp. CBTAP 102]|nr:hypothetical protein C8D70_112138 [Chryseobacterium sp. CBTAP 102]
MTFNFSCIFNYEAKFQLMNVKINSLKSKVILNNHEFYIDNA